MATEEQLRNYLKRATVELSQTRHRLTEVENRRNEPIAIVGMACRYPGGGETVEGYWELLRDGRSGVIEVPPSRWNIDDYYDPDPGAVGGMYTRYGAFLPDITGWDAEFFGLSPREALRMDPQQRLLMELAWEALEDAGTSPARLAGSRTGVMVGFMDTVQYARLQVERYGLAAIADPYLGQGSSSSVVAGRIAYHLDLHGPTLTIDTACSSSLIAVHLAAESLRRGECDLAMAAGATLIMHPDTFLSACAASMLSADGRCKTFDAGADGYVMGEGGGVVVLERLSEAIRSGRRIRAVLRGSAINQDGRSNGLTAPSRGAQADVITRALAAAGVAPDDVGYVEAHGSGTRLGDAIELSALHDVFGARSPQRPLHVGAVKTNLGHTQAAAGVAGLIKTALLLEHGFVPPNLHLTQPAPAIPEDGTIRPVTTAFPLPDDGRPWIAGVSSFGWSGTNAHLVLEAAPAPQEAPAAEGPDGPRMHALPVSAASGAALGEQLRRLATRLTDRPELDLADVAHTLQTGRAEHDHRLALVCTDRGDAARRLTIAAAMASDMGVYRGKGRPRIAFLLPGVGDQYLGLGGDLYRSEPVYAAAVDRCVELVHQRSGVDLRPMFFPAGEAVAGRAAPGDLAALIGRTSEHADAALDHAEIAHPYLFTVEYALAKLLAHWGVEPDLLVGYSLGEYVAACLAGVFSLADALHVVVERARLIGTVPAGRMVAVAAAEDRVRAVLTDVTGSGSGDSRSGTRFFGDVDVAALNGPSMTVLSGVPAEIDAVTSRLAGEGIACRPLRAAHAFHSSLLRPARDKLAALLDSVPRTAPTTTIVSNLTGAPLSREQATSAWYWADHLVSPVRFADSVRHCVAQDVDAFVELGAGQTLGGLVRQNLAGGSGATVFGTLPAMWTAGERRDDRIELLGTCGRLWELGVGVSWQATRPGRGRVISLPTYPFQRTRFWPEPAEPGQPAPQRSGKPADFCYAPTWQQDTARDARPAALRLPGPLVVFADAGGIGQRLADSASAAGTPVVEVVAGTRLRRDGRRIVIDPAVPEHYREVFGTLTEQGPVHVVHLWSLLATAPGPWYAGDDELRGAMGYGFDSMLLAVQALGELPGRRGVRLLTVSQGAAEVIGADATAPHRAAVHGLGRAVRHEYPGLTWSGVDLDPEAAGDLSVRQAAGQLGYELLWEPEPSAALATHHTLVGWRRGRRWLKGWGKVDLAGQADQPWRSDGVYLITGGTRGLGMALARHLVRAGVRRLALVGRSALSRDLRPDPDSRAARSLSAVAELEAAGAKVLLLTADVGEPDELRGVLRRCREHFGALHGVIHAAGVPAGGMVQRRTVAQARAVLAPKALAMGPLAELVGPATPADQRPEVLVLYSSAVTAFGGIGEADYCAANTVLDAYGEALSAAAPSTRIVSVAWGPWRHDDWQAEALRDAGGLAERVRAYRERYGFADDVGCALLDRLMTAGHGSVVAVRQSLRDVLRDWSAMLDIDALVGAKAAAPPGERFPRPQLRTEFVAPRTESETRIADVWGAYLGIDQVGVHDPFFDLGGNSLVGLAMVLAVEKELDVPIAPAVLFEHPTVAAFAAALERADAGGGDGCAAAQQALATSSARGQRRRRARSGSGK